MRRLGIGTRIESYHFKKILQQDGTVGERYIAILPTEVGELVTDDADWAYYMDEVADIAARREILDDIERLVSAQRLDNIIKDVRDAETPDELVSTQVQGNVGTTTLPVQPESVCAEADRLVDTEKDSDYGPPKEDFEVVATLWSEYLNRNLTAHNVGVMLLLLKVRRLMRKYKRDTLVDICGYAKCLEMIEEAEK